VASKALSPTPATSRSVIERRTHGEGKEKQADSRETRAEPAGSHTARLGRRKLSRIGKRDILSLIDGLRGEGPPSGRKGVLTALRTVLRNARENDLLVGDPFQGIPRDRLPAQEARSERRVLGGGDLNLLLAELRSRSVRDLAVGTVLADANLRGRNYAACSGRTSRSPTAPSRLRGSSTTIASRSSRRSRARGSGRFR
jgi:hypothetical protein